MCLVFINDLPEYLQSSNNDFILYPKISTDSHKKFFQDDLNNLTLWENKWGMKLYPDKFATIHISKSNHPNKHQYHLRGHLLKK